MAELKRQHMIAILRAQCVAVGVDYNVFFKPFTMHKDMPKRWYWKHTWTEEQQETFKKWLVKYFMVNLRIHSKLAEKESGWWILNYGWKTKEKK